jgi:hypothetical protein
MTDEPANWFYGLMAERCAEFNTDAPESLFSSAGWPTCKAGERFRGDYTDEPATPDSKELIFTALK